MWQERADDLEDDFIPDSSFAILSEEEEDNGEKHDQLASCSPTTSPGMADEQELVSRKRKRREKEKAKKEKRRKLEIQEHCASDGSQTLGRLPPGEAATFLSKHYQKAHPKLSALELQDLQISASCIADTSSYSGSRSADELGNFITHNFPRLLLRLGQNPRSNGAPTLLYIASAAMRVIEITRILQRYRGTRGGEVAKLFAKHNKLQDHITYLKRTKIGAAVGTPGRLTQLFENEVLSITALTHIFLDVTHHDTKKRTILDIPETRDELFHGILDRQSIRQVLSSGQVQVVLF